MIDVITGPPGATASHAASRPGALARRVASQGALLFSGFATAQACSFLRNAILGHSLAKGDFGIAVTLIMVLQLLESLTDVGADKLIVQAPAGDTPRFVATAHTVLIARGVLTTLLLYVASGPFCSFLGIVDAQPAFELISLVPLIKGFMHLDTRCAQRGLNNLPQTLIEVIPQVTALVLLVPALYFDASYTVVVGIAVAQAIASVLASHAVARRRYDIAFDMPILHQLLTFGWPIWLSAFPLFVVFQSDRLIIGKFFGMEALAGFSVAFLATMVPAIIAAKVGHALMLPLLAAQRDNPREFNARYENLSSVTAFAAALYLVVFGVAGGTLVPLAFGPNYAGHGNLTGWLALMWMVRMVQVVPGMALMAHGQTKPFLIAGLLRASTLPAAVWLALNGFSVESIAAAGVFGEWASLAYIVWRAGQCNPALPGISISSAAWLASVSVVVALTAAALGTATAPEHLAATLLLAACTTGYALMVHKSLSGGVATLMRHQRGRLEANSIREGATE